jgi:23S rRNA pseudouridine1911/1915/1917 synthase
LVHPITQEFMQWECPLPPDFASLLRALRDDTVWKA